MKQVNTGLNVGMEFRFTLREGTSVGSNGLNEPLILAERLTRVYHMGETSVIGLHDVNLEISEGAFVVLKGESGSGKSTLLSLMAGLDHPSDGRIVVAGMDLGRARTGDMTRYRREKVGMVFQSFNLMPTLSVLENVSLPALLANHPARAVEAHAGELLEWLQLGHRQHHLPAQLSGGEMQRTAIARALINNPRIILADEPTGNLDTRNGEIVMELLRDLNRNRHRTLVLATHSQLADSLATMIVTLRDGTIVDSTCGS
jgi:ABC-type lipoprotein export system ATPase subunit